eukprot:2918390-Pyramimonas_sp.AAC.1
MCALARSSVGLTPLAALHGKSGRRHSDICLSPRLSLLEGPPRLLSPRKSLDLPTPREEVGELTFQ